jgi:hypothetical protein
MLARREWRNILVKGKELQKICEQYPDFDFEFSFTDGYSKFPNIRSFNNLELCDVGHSDKVVVLNGEEK